VLNRLHTSIDINIPIVETSLSRSAVRKGPGFSSSLPIVRRPTQYGLRNTSLSSFMHTMRWYKFSMLLQVHRSYNWYEILLVVFSYSSIRRRPDDVFHDFVRFWTNYVMANKVARLYNCSVSGDILLASRSLLWLLRNGYGNQGSCSTSCSESAA
jgi:hypothetical protein